MLAVLGYATIAVFLVAILWARVSAIVALIVIPIVFGLFTGAGFGLGDMMLAGLMKVAPVAIMVMFALLYFGLMLNVGLFTPLIRWIVRLVKGDPLRVAVGTVLLTLLVALDGDGSTTFLLTVTALMPIYNRLGMNRLVMTTLIGVSCGIMNMTPWGGPTTRVITLMNGDSAGVFNPLIVPMAGGIAWAFLAAVFLGLRERRRLVQRPSTPESPAGQATGDVRTPRLFWFNAVLTTALIVALVASTFPLAVIFIVAYAVALVVNFPKWDDQRKEIAAQGESTVMVMGMIFAAGIFTGILTGTGMIGAMAAETVKIVPAQFAALFPGLVALTSMPLSMVITADAYYFGVLPVLIETGKSLGLDPYTIARAATLGHTTTGFPISPLVGATFVLIGRAEVALGDHQRAMFPWAFGATAVMALVAALLGAI